jgi:hypothetical protein
MLSGIGSKETLSEYDIPIVPETPEVGKNLFNHFALFQTWELQNPEKGFAIGSPLMANPAYFKGLMPVDWVINETVPFELLEPALQANTTEGTTSPPAHNRALLDPGRSHLEIITTYTSFGPPPDGTKILSYVMLTLPTSRGSLSVNSTSPTDPRLSIPTIMPQTPTVLL